MRYLKSQATGKAGVIHISNIVNTHGSVFHPVHQEDDLGIDGFIELVHYESTSGHLVAVQIKSGESYVAKTQDAFEVDIDERHLNYWNNFMVPVILICYSPTKNLAAWISVRDYLETEKYHKRLPLKKLIVPFHKPFDAKALSHQIAGLVHARADERILLKCADMCLSADSETRHSGFEILSRHPDSRRLKITCQIARQLILDENIDTAKDALHILGFGVGRFRWSGNPGNQEEADVMAYANDLCSNLSPNEIWRLVELCDDEYFSGPSGLGERCLDIINCCREIAEDILVNIAADPAQPLQRRANALYLLCQCDDEMLENAAPGFRQDKNLSDVIEWMFQKQES